LQALQISVFGVEDAKTDCGACMTKQKKIKKIDTGWIAAAL